MGAAVDIVRSTGPCCRHGSCQVSFTRRFGKMSCWQPKLEPGPRLDQFEASVRVRSTFLTDFFLFLCRKFTFGGPETGSEKKSILKTASTSANEQI